MDGPFLPWWMLLLLGAWAVALTIWQNPFAHRELRFWSGALTVAYLGLILLTANLGPTEPEATSSIRSASLSHFFAIVFMTVSLLAGIQIVGCVSVMTKQVGYLLLTIANALFCVCLDRIEIAIGLGIVACYLARSLHRSGTFSSLVAKGSSFRDYFRLNHSLRIGNTGSEFLLGAFNVVFTIMLIGTLSYSLRVETTPPATGPGHSVLPSHEFLKRFQPHSASLEQYATGQTSALDQIFGSRADLLMLPAVIIFLTLGSFLTEPNLCTSPNINETCERQEGPANEV